LLLKLLLQRGIVGRCVLVVPFRFHRRFAIDVRVCVTIA